LIYLTKTVFLYHSAQVGHIFFWCCKQIKFLHTAQLTLDFRTSRLGQNVHLPVVVAGLGAASTTFGNTSRYATLGNTFTQCSRLSSENKGSNSGLITSLQEISRTLSKNNFPLPTYTSSVAKYLDIIELEAYQSENKVVFVLLIPLVEPETYTLFRPFPIPILDNRTGLFHILQTTKNYIARDDDSLLYVSLQNLKNCKNLQTKVKICSNLLQYPIDSDAICEAQLLRQQNVLPRTCQTSVLVATDYNVQEVDYNLWLVTISEPLPATVRCGSRNPESQILKTNSIIKLSQPNCNACIGSTRIHSKYLVQERYVSKPFCEDSL